MKALTEKQKSVISFISSFIMAHKYPPTIREIAEHFQISVKGAYDHLKALERKGRVRCDINRSRAIELLEETEADPDAAYVTIPILGTVAAGRPIFADENYEGMIRLPSDMLSRGAQYFALRVRGDSMIDAGILSGDLAIIKKRETAENGSIVVAMVDEAVTLKRFYKEQNRVRLQPENPRHRPIYTTDCRVLGTLSRLVRDYE
jgi:repressor LexA